MKRRITAVAAAFLAVAAAACNGQPDPGFGTNGSTTAGVLFWDRVYDIALQPDGKIVAVGASSTVWNSDGPQVFSAVRFNPDGTLDTSFSGDGMVTIDFPAYEKERASAVAVLSDGSIVIGGRSLPGNIDTLLLAQLTPHGELVPDAGNQPDGTSVWIGSQIDPDISLLSLQEMVALPNGQFLVAAGNVVSRFGGGEDALFPDVTFGGRSDGEEGFLRIDQPHAFIRVNDVATRADGDLVIATDSAVWAAESTGHLPTMIEELEGGTSYYTVDVQPDGKILASGRSLVGWDSFFVARLLPDGTPDASFHADFGDPVNPGYQYGWAVEFEAQSDGKSLAFTGDGITRRNHDGTVDTAFGTNGTVSVPSDGGDGDAQVDPTGIALQPDGMIVASGAVASGLNLDYWIGRFTP